MTSGLEREIFAYRCRIDARLLAFEVRLNAFIWSSAEIARREAIAYDFLVSGAMLSDLCAVEVKRPLEKFDMNDRSNVLRLPMLSEWRIA